jgi:hypothetical protein
LLMIYFSLALLSGLCKSSAGLRFLREHLARFILSSNYLDW